MSERNDEKDFYKNLYDAIENLDTDPVTEEYENFIVGGKELTPEAQLYREYCRILLNFTHLKGQEFDFAKHNSFRNIIDKISNLLKSGSYNYETLKKIIVHLDLELGVEVFFVTSLSKMIGNGLDNVKDYSQFEVFNYETLALHYSTDFYKRFK